MKDGEQGCRGGVVSLDRPVTGAIDQRVVHDECRDEVVDAIALGVYRVFDASLSSSKTKYFFLFFCLCLPRNLVGKQVFKMIQ